MNQFAKATYNVMHQIILLCSENEQLCEINYVLSKRRRIKNKRLQTEESLTIAESQKLLITRDDVSAIESEESENSHSRKRVATDAQCCDICGETEHNARICQTNVEISDEDDFD